MTLKLKSKLYFFISFYFLLHFVSTSIISSNGNFDIQIESEKMDINSKSFCPPGCLKCIDFQCLLCDFYSGYSFQSSSCRPPNDSNCLIQGHSDKCLQCAKGFYFNTVDQVCVELASDEFLDHCEFYSGPLTCIICSTGYIISDSTCVQPQRLSIITDVDLLYYKYYIFLFFKFFKKNFRS
jgi:hypothetical protein